MRNWSIYSVDPVNERPTFASLEGFRSLKKKKHLLKGGLETAKYVNVQSFSGCLDHLVTQQNNCLDLQALEGNSHRKVNSN